MSEPSTSDREMSGGDFSVRGSHLRVANIIQLIQEFSEKAQDLLKDLRTEGARSVRIFWMTNLIAALFTISAGVLPSIIHEYVSYLAKAQPSAIDPFFLYGWLDSRRVTVILVLIFVFWLFSALFTEIHRINNLRNRIRHLENRLRYLVSIGNQFLDQSSAGEMTVMAENKFQLGFKLSEAEFLLEEIIRCERRPLVQVFLIGY